MFFDQTYEVILGRMITRVRESFPDLDTREGSVIFFALGPAAREMAAMYRDMDALLNETFADTASRDYLILRCAERGIVVEPATSAIRQGEFSMDIPVGSRFSLNQLNYVALERLSAGVFKMECETPGNAGNLESGTLIPINYIDGLAWARLTDVLIPGEDEESTEALRRRYFDSLHSQAFGGNIADYKEKIHSLQGVGGVKVYPVWNGGGTVRIVIVDSTFYQPSTMLVDEVQTAIDPVQNQGVGLGLAPIGHVVTVDPVSETAINIVTAITYQPGWDWAAVQPNAEAAIDQYFTDLSEGWADTDALVVRISQLETRLLGVNGILDIQGTTLNGSAQNIILDADSIPKRGSVNA